jgi:hypothetical protein
MSIPWVPIGGTSYISRFSRWKAVFRSRPEGCDRRIRISDFCDRHYGSDSEKFARKPRHLRGAIARLIEDF